MAAMSGGFGPFSAGALNEILHRVTTAQSHQLEDSVLHDVQYRGGHFYAIIEIHRRNQHGVLGKTYYGLTTASVPADAIGHQLRSGQTQVFVWVHPADPLLPGLPIAATPTHVKALFVPHRDLRGLHTVTYRPLNRAVFRAPLAPQYPGGAMDTLYLKVLRVGEAAPLYELHRRLAAAGFPVVEPVRPPVTDVVALKGGAGMALGEYIKAEGTYNRFDPAQLVELLDRIPSEVLNLPHRVSWADRHLEFLALASRAMPHEQERIARLGDRLMQAHEWLDLGPVVATHGDLYEAHILVDPVSGRIQQILDVDGAGPGYRVDDYACLIGHLAVLGATQATSWGWLAAMRTFQQLAPHTHPRALAVRAAAVVISLIPAYQPDASLQARGRSYLTVAETLLELA